jgi:peptidoglycan L-alanyl-D-glutamate endopeptidase CwlK
MDLPDKYLKKLKGVHPDLCRVVYRASAMTNTLPPGVSFGISEGVRTEAQQAINIERGVSWTMKSRHIPSSNECNLACAVDLFVLIEGTVSWAWPLYHDLAALMKAAADFENVPIEWGGDWKGKRKDGPHFQLPKDKYPESK